jgi:peroxiredoxin-like protein
MSEAHSSYAVDVRWTGGKRGIASASDGLPGIEVASPPQFGGPPGTWTPEHFYAAAAAACWMTTFAVVAELSKLEVAASSITGEAFVERGDDRRFSIPRIVLRPRVAVRREEDRDRALRLIQKAEDACLVARSIRTAIELVPEIEVLSPADLQPVS